MMVSDSMERVSKVMGKLKFPDDTVSPEHLACAAWPSAVGKRIAVHARAVRLVRAHLVVEVGDAVWQHQLFALRHQIQRKLDQELGTGIVEEIEFRVVPARRGPDRALEVAAAPALADEADQIGDPFMRRIYKAARKKESA
jgi:hypothetical protein